MWDTAYQFHLASRLLDGARLYVDTGADDMHPPLVTWGAVVVEWLGRGLGLDGLAIHGVLVVLLVALSLALMRWVGCRDVFVLTAAAFVLLPLAGPFLGEGEHLALVLALPYVVAASDATQSLPRSKRLTVALLAAIGFSLKPYFALIPLLIELECCRRRRTWWPFRSEVLMLGAVFLAYVVLTALVTPQFFRELPWLFALYPRYNRSSFGALLFNPDVAVLALAIGVGFWSRRTRSGGLIVMLMLEAVALFFVVLLQQKGWDYHWYPVLATSFLVFAVVVRDRSRLVQTFVPAFALAIVVMFGVQKTVIERELAEAPTYLPQFARVLGEWNEPPIVLALTPVLSVGFPLVQVVGADWASPYGHLWMIPAMYPGIADGVTPLVLRDPGRWDIVEQRVFDRLWEECVRKNPNVIILQDTLNGRFDMRAYFASDPRFAALLRESTVVARVGPYSILRPASSATVESSGGRAVSRRP